VRCVKRRCKRVTSNIVPIPIHNPHQRAGSATFANEYIHDAQINPALALKNFERVFSLVIEDHVSADLFHERDLLLAARARDDAQPVEFGELDDEGPHRARACGDENCLALSNEINQLQSSEDLKVLIRSITFTG
jgi:hypothetical protein